MNPRSSALLALTLVASLSAQTLPLKENDAQKDEPILLNVFQVKTEEDKGYGVSTSSSATRFAMPLKDIPQSVNVVTAAFLKDTFSYNLSDAAKYVPGVSKRSPTFPYQLFVRGFLVQNLFQDGFRLASDSIGTQNGGDLANVARIEIIKGPASAVAGRGEVGGAVNFITKRPGRRPQSEITVTAGSLDFYRAVVDSTGPLNADGSLRYRVIGVAQDSEGFKPFQKTRKAVAFPTIDWDLSERTQLSLTGTVGSFRLPGSGGQTTFLTRRTPGNPASLVDQITPRRANWSGEEWEKSMHEQNSWLLSATHRFNKVFTFRQGIQYLASDSLRYWIEPSPVVSFNAAGDMIRSRQYREFKDIFNQYFIQGELVAKFRFLQTDNISLIAYEFGRKELDSSTLLGTLPAFNTTRPVYGARPTSVFADNSSITKLETAGIAAQHQLSLLKDRVKIMAGVRFDEGYSRQAFSVRTAGPLLVVNQWGSYTASPRYGITLSPTRWLSFYGVQSEDKQEPSTILRFPLLPASDPRSRETITAGRDGRLREAGVKAELFGGRLSATLAAFDITRSGQALNILRTLPDGTAFNEVFFSQGEQSKGFELQVFGSITSRIEIVASYADTKTSNIIATGKVFMSSVPRTEFRTAVKYSFHEPGQAGFSVRAGHVKFGEMWGTVDNLLRIAPQSRSDVGVGYTWKRYTFDLQVNNVFDDYFIEAMAFSTGVNYTPPRQVFAAVTRKW